MGTEVVIAGSVIITVDFLPDPRLGLGPSCPVASLQSLLIKLSVSTLPGNWTRTIRERYAGNHSRTVGLRGQPFANGTRVG